MMDRHTFLQQLRALLADTSAEEREEAIRYYEEYFDEAGPEQEQAVLAELGSPARVAAILRANVPGQTAKAARPGGTGGAGQTPPASNAPDGAGRPGPSLSEAAQTVAAGVSSIRSRIRGLAEWDSAPHAPNPPCPEGDGPVYARPAPGAADTADGGPVSGAADGPASYSYDAAAPDAAGPDTAPGPAENAGRRKLLVIFLVILLSPVWLGLLGGLLGLIAGAFGALIGLVAAGVGGFFTAIAGLGSAVGLLASSPANGLVALAGCLLAAGIGILLFGVGGFCIGLLPKAVRALIRLVRGIIHRGGDEA